MKSTKSENPFIENALCLCSKCSRFLVISKCSLFSTDETTQMISNTNKSQQSAFNAENMQNSSNQSNYKNSSNANICILKDKKKWIYLKNYEKIYKNMQSFQCIPFPLCPSCCIRCIIQIKMQQSYISKTDKLYNYIPKELTPKIIECSIQQIRNESTTEHFNLLKNFNSLSHKSRTVSFIEQKRNIKEQYKVNDSCILSLNYPTYPENKISHLSLTLIPSFWISTDRHYITINNARIGFYGFRTNTAEENNVGLQFVSHLMWALSKTFCIKFRNFEILPSGVFRAPKNTFLYLKIPETNQKKDISNFNLALDMLFYAAAAFFTYPDISECCGIPPFEIDVENHMIASFSYKYGETPQLLENWSISMRLLLFNLKLLQVRSSSMYLSNS